MIDASYRLFGRTIFSTFALLSLVATDPAWAVIDEITVTARKRAESVQEVPIAVSTLDSDALDVVTTGGADLRILNGRLPSIRVESSFGRSFPRFYIRGLGNSDFDLNASQPVSLVYDEVVLENPIIKGKPIFDVERVEIARGPQGTLFGRNTPAGVIKFVTKKPGEEADGYFSASYGRFDTKSLEGAIGGPLNDVFSARVSGQWLDREEWIDNRAPGFEADDQLGGYTQWALRGQLVYKPNDEFDALLTLHAWDIDGEARIFHANIFNPGSTSLRAGFDPDTVFQDAGSRNGQSVEATGASLVWNYDFGNVTLTSVTGIESVEMFSRGDVDGGFGAVFAPGIPMGPGVINIPSETADGIPDLDQITQEFRLAGEGGDNWNWLLGLYYFTEDARFETFNFDTFAGGVQQGFSFVEQDTDAWAVFGSVDWELTDQWTITAGLRFSDDEKESSAQRPEPVFQSPTSAPIKTMVDDSFVSWDLSAVYALNDDVNLYGRVATSSRAPSIQARILFAADFAGGTDPDTNGVSVAETEDILSFELGMKSELWDNRLRLNLAAFMYQIDDQQVSAVGGATNIARLLNVDTTDGYGFEADVEAAPNETWTITLGFSYNDTEFDDPNLVTFPCGGGCTTTDPIVNGLVQLDGNSLPHAPEIVFNGIVRGVWPLGQGQVYGVLDWAYHDEARFFLYEAAEFEDDNFELGARLGFMHDDGWEVAIYGRNITDEEIVNSGIDFSNLLGMVNDPFTWGLEFKAKFGQ